MVGREIHAGDSLGIGRPIAVVVMVLCVLGAITDKKEPEIYYFMAAAPLLYIVVRSLRSLPAVRLRIGEHSIERLDSPGEIPYAEIEAITADGHFAPAGRYPAPAVPIQIRHARGNLIIPPVIKGATPAETYTFLLERVPPRQLALPTELIEHRDQQSELFGAEKVFAFGARHYSKPSRRGRGWRCMGSALLLWGVLAILPASTSDDPGPWIGAAAGGILFGFLFWLVGVSRSGTELAIQKQSGGGIVISPAGVALKQGPLTGHLKWEEIRDIRTFAPGAVRVTNSRPYGGTLLQLDGTAIVVADVYDAPREDIEAKLRAYWRPAG